MKETHTATDDGIAARTPEYTGGREGFVTFRHAGYAWLAAPSFADVVKSDPRVLEPEGDAVKSGPARTVWQFAPEGFPGGVFVKRYHTPGILDTVKYAVQPAKAMREFRTAVELLRRGVTAPEPLAVGVKRTGPALHDSVFVSRALVGVEPVDKYVRERLDTASHREVRAFTQRLARFVSGMHDAGVLHRDFHGGNILVGGAPTEPDFSLVDLHDVRVGEPLLTGERIMNLAVLGRFFCLFVPRHWRLRFLKSYFGPDVDVYLTARLIEHAAEKGMRRVWYKRDSRVCGNNKYFHHVAVGPFSGRARRTAIARVALALFKDGDPFARAEAVIKDSRSSTVGVFRVDTPDGEKRLFIKRRNARPGLASALDPCRASRATRGFFYGVAFDHRHLPTPHVLAALEDRPLGFHRSSYLVTEFVPEAENLGDAIAAGEESPLYRRIAADRARFVSDLARIVRRMHWSGLSMRDLKAANILLYPQPDGRVGIELSDLDAARLYRFGVPRSRAMQNIARIYVDAVDSGAFSRRDALLFLNEYLGYPERHVLSRWISGVRRHAAKVRAMLRRRA